MTLNETFILYRAHYWMPSCTTRGQRKYSVKNRKSNWALHISLLPENIHQFETWKKLFYWFICTREFDRHSNFQTNLGWSFSFKNRKKALPPSRIRFFSLQKLFFQRPTNLSEKLIRLTLAAFVPTYYYVRLDERRLRVALLSIASLAKWCAVQSTITRTYPCVGMACTRVYLTYNMYVILCVRALTSK